MYGIDYRMCQTSKPFPCLQYLDDALCSRERSEQTLKPSAPCSSSVTLKRIFVYSNSNARAHTHSKTSACDTTKQKFLSRLPNQTTRPTLPCLYHQPGHTRNPRLLTFFFTSTSESGVSEIAPLFLLCSDSSSPSYCRHLSSRPLRSVASLGFPVKQLVFINNSYS